MNQDDVDRERFELFLEAIETAASACMDDDGAADSELFTALVVILRRVIDAIDEVDPRRAEQLLKGAIEVLCERPRSRD